jgi:NhaP-type Na+/H+ or K+/H+ antiporter
MQATIDRVLVVVMSVGAAIMAAVTVGYVAHYDFGLSRQEIRTSALVGAIVIAGLLAVEHFGEKFRKPK